ncbi:MAG: hypothetical protein E7774_05305 [Bradyrhizobium sp.]|nr:MAG: hypothetical protein E7774_05305 [Bradyrhizobium sp.]
MSTRHSYVFAFALALAAAAWATPSLAQNCGEDMNKLGMRLKAERDTIGELIKQAKGKPLDPEVFCAKSGGLTGAEGALLAYMDKNKDWCQIPDEMVDGLKKTHAQDTAFSAKACGYAAKIKKMKEQQADGGAPQAQQLPTGPL